MNTPIDLTEDERACVHRALSIRRDYLRNEQLIINEQPIQPPYAEPAKLLLARELELIATTIRKLWIGTGGDNGNYSNKG